jgi:hypothetical protein
MAAMNSATRSLNHRRISPVESGFPRPSARTLQLAWTLSPPGMASVRRTVVLKPSMDAVRFLHRLTRGRPEVRGATTLRTHEAGVVGRIAHEAEHLARGFAVCDHNIVTSALTQIGQSAHLAGAAVRPLIDERSAVQFSSPRPHICASTRLSLATTPGSYEGSIHACKTHTQT